MAGVEASFANQVAWSMAAPSFPSAVTAFRIGCGTKRSTGSLGALPAPRLTSICVDKFSQYFSERQTAGRFTAPFSKLFV